MEGSFNNYVTFEGRREGYARRCNCDGGGRSCESVTYAYKKNYIQNLGSAVSVTRLILVVTNPNNHQFVGLDYMD